MAATARRIEPSTTPRPSISPLSSASKPNRSSPIATRDAIMAGRTVSGETELDGDTNTHAENGELEDDRSSSLSEPEDIDGDEELDNEDEDDIDDGQDGAPERSLDADSEAETERLEQTPSKSRRHAESTGRTPSKLIHATALDDELSDPPSPLPIGAGATSSTSTGATAGLKRKRSETADSSLSSAESDIGESPRKRSQGSHPAPELGVRGTRQMENGTSDSAVEDSVEDTAIANDDAPELPASAVARGARGRRGKHKGRKAKEIPQESTPAPTDEPAETLEEPSAEALAKSEEEQKHKADASSFFEELAKQFNSFRSKLYNERLENLTAQLNLLAQPDCVHPEYMRQVAAVDARLDKQTLEAHAFYKYRLQCIKDRVLGERSQLLSQYFQEVRDVREKVMYKLGEDWYGIQKDRRQTNQEKDESYMYKFPAKKSVQIRQQAKYNQEVSILSGIAKYVGFPAAPEINGAQPDGVDQDLKAMRIARRAPQPVPQSQPPPFMPRPTMPSMISAQSERLAHEQFIEQNAWARPQPSIHSNHGTPGATHTLDWVDPSHNVGRNTIAHTVDGQMRGINSSPFTTPLPDKRLPVEHSSAGTVAVNSDGLGPPSSVQPMPPTSDRLRNEQASPLNIIKSRQNGAELTGFRNFSNISGASTIDAPDSEREREGPPNVQHAYPDPGGRQAFDTSQLLRQEGDKDIQASSRFRAQDGAFGMPAPLPTANNAQ